MPTVKLSSPGKVLFPGDGITKEELADYYQAVADAMLPHIHDRPLSLQVFPGGLKRPGHFLKQIPDYFPDWVDRVELPKRGGTVTHVVANRPQTLRMLSQHNTIAIHAPTARRDRMERPDRLILDFDPEEAGDWPLVVEGARLAADAVAASGLEPFLMTTGSRGLHVLAPLRRESDYDAVMEMGKDIARIVIAQRPDAFTTAFMKDKRDGKVFVDVLRNRPAQTAVVPYSARAKAGAPVATPIARSELDAATLRPDGWSVRTLPERLAAGDPWAGIGGAAASPRSAAKALAKAAAET